ncbi:MAG: ABC transporter permease subunit [Terrimicrobiaceae bacterium]|nr:ABC transporter permease subunit [Terrimicrobiaceae bacterium]
MDSLPNPVILPAASAAIGALLGIKLAFWRVRGRRAGFAALDVLALLPAFFPAQLLAAGMQSLVGDSPLSFPPLWPVLAVGIVSMPFAYLPARIAFARIDREFRDTARVIGMNVLQRAVRIDLRMAWPSLALGALLATARTLSAYGTEIFSDAAAAALILAFSLAAALLLARAINRPASQP